jgi:hypothetical protein
MSTMIDIARFRSLRLLQGSERARPSAIATAAASRDLIAVAAFSAIGLFLSLSFALLFAGGLSFVAEMP